MSKYQFRCVAGLQYLTLSYVVPHWWARAMFGVIAFCFLIAAIFTKEGP